MRTKTTIIAFKAEPELKQAIESEARRARLGVSEWIRLAIAPYLQAKPKMAQRAKRAKWI